MTNKYVLYLAALLKPFKKLAKLEFLNPDGTVSFFIDNNPNKNAGNNFSTAYIQDGTLNVSLQNGQRRSANITLSNLDGAFNYSINKLWFGKQVRLLMGLQLPDGTDFYLPQGVFYLNTPTTTINPNQKTITYELVDKWAYLDGTLFGNLSSTYIVPTQTDGQPTNVFDAMAEALTLSKFDFSTTTDSPADLEKQIDNVTPIFTTYYNGKTYPLYTGGTAAMTDVPYTVTVQAGSTLANLLLELNNIPVGWIGYDITGALRCDASQEDINDAEKPILWAFTPRNSILCGLTETAQVGDVFNDVLIVGEGLEGYEVYGRASNYDPQSDTNINIIGKKTFYEERAEYWNAEQCIGLANFHLKRKTVLQKSITIECSQMFHLIENNLVSVERTDKEGSPVEKHLIQSFSLPIGETGSMSIQCISVNDFPQVTTSSSLS